MCSYEVSNRFLIRGKEKLEIHCIAGLEEGNRIREKEEGSEIKRDTSLHLGDLIPRWYQQELVKKPSSSSYPLCWICVGRLDRINEEGVEFVCLGLLGYGVSS